MTDTTVTFTRPDAAGIAAMVERLRDTVRGGHTSLAWRAQQLLTLNAFLEECRFELVAALASDLGKPGAEATTDIALTQVEIGHMLDHMEEWAVPRPVPVPDMWAPATAEIVPEPVGVVLVVSPWNYPLQLLLQPVAAAFAAGNTVVAKPSELAPATSAVLARELTARFDDDVLVVVEGGPEHTTDVLRHRFDHIFFTGSTAVGRSVAQAAARYLTPTTLELGGKSPTYVHAGAHIPAAAERIAWAKFSNAGQTCVAPDHVLIDRDVRDEFLTEMAAVIERFYGQDAAASPSYGRVVNDHHVERLMRLREGDGSGELVIDGCVNRAERYIGPTVLLDPEPTSAVMQEEIFGPLLPVIPVDGVDDAVARASAGPIPLASYVFTENESVAERWIRQVPAGGTGVNVAVIHIVLPDLPFGGRGDSGMGSYHGQAGFDRLSHLRSVLAKSSDADLSPLLPPYA